MKRLFLISLMTVLAFVLVFGGCAKPAPVPAPAPAPAPTAKPAPAPSPTSAQIVWKLNSAFTAEHKAFQQLKVAVDDITKRTQGRLIIELYPNFSLGFKVGSWLADHKSGAIDISHLVTLQVGTQEPSFSVIEATLAMKNKTQAVKAIKALGDFKKKMYKEVYNSELIASGSNPSALAVVGTKGRQIKTIADFKGLKLRADTVLIKDVFNELGAKPQTMPLGEVYMAMKTGVIDGYNTGYGSIYEKKYHEVTDYLTFIGASGALTIDMVVSNDRWQKLPDDIKKIVAEEFAKWAENSYRVAISLVEDEADKKKCEAAGVKTAELPQKDIDFIHQTALRLHEEWVKAQGGITVEAWNIVKPIIKE